MQALKLNPVHATFTPSDDDGFRRLSEAMNCRNKTTWEGFGPETLMVSHLRGDRQPDGAWRFAVELEIRPGRDEVSVMYTTDDGPACQTISPYRYGSPVDFAELGLVLVRPRQPIP